MSRKTVLCIVFALAVLFLGFRVLFTPAPSPSIPLPAVNGDLAEGEWIETLSWEPRVFLYHNFCTREEARHIVALGEKKIERSKVVTGTSGIHDSRTSSGVFLLGEMRKDPIVKKFEEKVALWTHLPVENGEAFYLLRYEIGEQYKPHNDWFRERKNQRVATVILYLGEPETGGETVFPKTKLSLKPLLGSAVLFWNVLPDGSEDPLTLHASLPVTKGTKWALTKWIREKPF